MRRFAHLLCLALLAPMFALAAIVVLVTATGVCVAIRATLRAAHPDLDDES